MEEELSMINIGPSPHELTPNQVAKLVDSSSRRDWLFDEEQDIYSFRKNLLVRIENSPDGPKKKRVVFYGSQAVAIVADINQLFRQASSGVITQVQVVSSSAGRPIQSLEIS